MAAKQNNTRFLHPYPIPAELKPRAGYSGPGLQAREESVRKYASLAPGELLKCDSGTPFSIVYRRDYSESLKKLGSGRSPDALTPTAADVVHARGRTPPQYRIAEDLCPPFPNPIEWKLPFPRGAVYEKEIVDRIKQLHELLPNRGSSPPPDLDSAPSQLQPGWGATLIGTYFGAGAGRVVTEVADGTSIDLIVSSWTETRVEAYLDPDLGGLRPHPGRIWIVTAGHVTSNWRASEFLPVLSLSVAFDGICVNAGAAGYPVTSWPYNDPENLTIRDGQSLGDADFEITNVNHWHEGEGHSELVAPNAGGQSLAQGVHIGLGSFEDGCAEIMYTVAGPRGISPPAITGLTWGFLRDAS
jgi:hypothetical protein